MSPQSRFIPLLNRKASLSADFTFLSILCFIVMMVVAVGFWVQVYDEALQQKEAQLQEEAMRIDSALTDSMDYITQYAAFIGDKIIERDDASDLAYISRLITGKAGSRMQEHNFYFTTTFDWVTPDKQLRVSNKIGVLPEPFDMSDRDYLQRTEQMPWTLQLSPPRLGGLSGEWILPAGMGISDKHGKFLGSITLGFALKGLERRMHTILGMTDVRYLLLTSDMDLALDSTADNAAGPNPEFGHPLPPSEMERVSSGYLRMPVDFGGTSYTYMRKLEKYPYVLLVGYDRFMAANLFNELVLSRIIPLFFLGLCVLGLLYAIRMRIVQPVTRLAQAANRICRGEEVALPASPLHEINMLSEAMQKISDYIQKEHKTNQELTQKTNELSHANAEAIRARDAAIKADQAKSEFLANMSHELRTPLNAIIGLTRILLMRPFSPEKIKEYIQTMHMSAEQLLRLINDLLDITKLEERHVQLEAIAFDLGQLVQEVMRIHEVPAREKRLNLVAHMPPGPLLFVGDPSRLRQVLMNLVSNAIKFTEKGTVSIDLSCAPSEQAQRMDLTLCVSDTGIGIPPDKLDTIFDKFSQADSSITRKYGGSGLGLSISKTLAELMRGRLEAKSTHGIGSQFVLHLTLPVARQLPSEEFEAPPPAKSTQQGQRILVVEDNKNNIMVVASLLEMYGYAYTLVRNGQQALDAFISDHFDIVLMDIQMPEMDGFAATRHIRAHEKLTSRAPASIIGMTAFALAGDRERCLEVGMNNYISKPFDPKQLLAMLQHYLENPQKPFVGEVA